MVCMLLGTGKPAGLPEVKQVCASIHEGSEELPVAQVAAHQEEGKIQEVHRTSYERDTGRHFRRDREREARTRDLLATVLGKAKTR